MVLKLWQGFTKRAASTKRPTAPPVTKQVQLKEPTNMLNPVFLIEGIDWTYNYCQWNGRYYYIANITAENGYQSSLTCRVDYLATWKGAITASELYVKYGSTEYNKVTRDMRYVPTESNRSQQHFALTTTMNQVGSYIVSILGDNPNGTMGAATLYAMYDFQIAQLMNEITADDFWDALKQKLSNPFEYLVGVQWIPYSVDQIEGEDKTVVLGNNPTTITAKRITNYIKKETFNLDLREGDSILDGSFLDTPPYTIGTLYLPFIGCVPLDLSTMFTFSTIYIESTVDLSTGAICYIVGRTVNDKYTSTYSGKCSSSVPINSSNYDPIGQTGGIIQAVGGAAVAIAGLATGNPFAFIGGLTSEISGVIGEIHASEVHSQSNGEISSRIGSYVGLYIYATVYRKVGVQTIDNQERLAVMGLPVEKVIKLSSMTGYVQTVGASINMAGTPEEKTAVESALDRGIYIE